MMTKWEPLKELLSLQDQVNRIFDVSTPGNGHFERDWVPVVDVFENAEKIDIRVEVPGMDLKEIEIKLDGDLLTLRGEKKLDGNELGKYQQIESVYGRFARSFNLPATVDRERIQATYQQGVLKLTLPKREESKPRSITIEAA
jgi:HSP20 family protein